MKDIKIKIILEVNLDVYELFPYLSKDKFKFIYTDNPDYIIHSQVNGKEYLNYDCIRISLDTERISPDFNVCDYAIADDFMGYGDRYFRMPQLAYKMFNQPEWNRLKTEGLRVFSLADLENKQYFCNFIYSNSQADDMRLKLFLAISEYKHVHSAGRMLNNIGCFLGRGEGDRLYDEKNRFSKEV